MAKKTSYTQCKMHKPCEKGYSFYTAWIPTKHAKVGKHIKIRRNGEWEDGWKVVEAHSKAFWTPEEIAEREKRWEQHRKHSDI